MKDEIPSDSTREAVDTPDTASTEKTGKTAENASSKAWADLMRDVNKARGSDASAASAGAASESNLKTSQTERPESAARQARTSSQESGPGAERNASPESASGTSKAARQKTASGAERNSRVNSASGTSRAARPKTASGTVKTERPEAASRTSKQARPETAARSAKSAKPVKSARPESMRTGDPARKRTNGSSPQSRKRKAALARRRKKRRLLIAASAAVLVLLIVICIFVVRGCKSRKNGSSTSTEPVTGEAVQGSFAITGGDEVEEASAAEATPTPVPDPYADKPDIDINSWEYILANATYSIEEYRPETEYFEDVQLDYRIIEPMSRFVEDARAQGLSVFMSSGYRDYDEQSWLFNMKVEEYGDEAVAATIVAPPGTSEHQTGLAADITDDYYETKNESLENTELYKWMSAHCQEYGFIVRFPKGKEDVTGIIYEPWHFRYVGVEAATYIMEHNLTLEEFIELYKN